MNDIYVFDLFENQFRPLDSDNYNDDIKVGIIYFKREALTELPTNYFIVGYEIFEHDTGISHPIDIQENHILLFEGVFNSLPKDIKLVLIKYLKNDFEIIPLSRFMYEWQILASFTAFENNGKFIELCSNIIGDSKLMETIDNLRMSIYTPKNYDELCAMVNNLNTLNLIEFYKTDFDARHKYLIYSLIHRHHIKLSAANISFIWQSLSNEIIRHQEDKNEQQ